MSNSIFNLSKAPSILITFFGLVTLLRPSAAFSQKNSFTNYSIEDGLIQSQAMHIAQDRSHRLIIATVLGMDKFNGKTFTPITKGTGINDIDIPDATADHRENSLTVDHKGTIWCSDSKGLYSYYADKATRFIDTKSGTGVVARALIADNQDNIWGLRKQLLFKITGGNHLENINITGGNDTVSAIALNNNGDLLAAVFHKGIFCLKNNKWVETVPIAFAKKNTYVLQFFVKKKDDDVIYLSTGSEVFSVKNNIVTPVFQKSGKVIINCIAQDNLGGLWIGTLEGAYHLFNNTIAYYNAKNGFTNTEVTALFKDIDGNIWLGTNGNGIFRYNGDNFVTFDQSQGLPDEIMQLARDDNKSVLMASPLTLFVYNGKDIRVVKTPFADSANIRIACLYTDKEKNTWIGTNHSLWKKRGQNFTCFYPRNKNDPPMLFFRVLKDQLNTLWAASWTGCYYWDKGFKKIGGINFFCTGAVEVGRDSILVGSKNGASLIINKKLDRGFKTDFLKGSEVMCMQYYKGRVFIGTFERGLFIWDPRGRTFTKLDEKNGLSSNSVYSVAIDKNDVLWVGTGRAVNQFKIKDNGSFYKLERDNVNDMVVECNQGALLIDNNKGWVGTTKALVVFNNLRRNSFTAPHTIMQDVLVYNKQAVNYTFKNGYKEPENLKLPFDNSHITLSFIGVYLKDPGSVSYRYKLWPLTNKYSSLSKNNVVDYQSLLPGKYVFYVKSYTEAGRGSNIARFAFEVTPAYYQTALFKVVMALLLFLIAALTWKYVKIKDEQKRKLIAHLRLEEQVKIRRQTAEDFHDDLGNKLTRINVLADILYKKIDTAFSDQRKLIDQIKENADSLFTGSKHILWALDPDNDRLSEVLIHIKEFGIDLFLNTAISFTSNLTDDIFKEITLPMGYGRNITMIFKELFNNTLRHSGAKNVKASAFLNQGNNICIIVEDDGKGFDVNTIKSGNGMRNINNRAKKMNGIIETRSSLDESTSVTLIIKRIPHLY